MWTVNAFYRGDRVKFQDRKELILSVVNEQLNIGQFSWKSSNLYSDLLSQPLYVTQ